MNPPVSDNPEVAPVPAGATGNAAPVADGPLDPPALGGEVSGVRGSSDVDFAPSPLTPLPLSTGGEGDQNLAPDDFEDDPLQDDLEDALADFRDWYLDAADGPAGLPEADASPAIDVATLLGHFVALRQEVNLQTRAARAQQEQTANSLDQLHQALDLCSRSQTRAEQLDRSGSDEKLRPLLSTLADLYDSLAIAAGQIRRVTTGVVPQLQEILEEDPGGEPASPPPPFERPTARSFWSRWILSPTADAALRSGEEQSRQVRDARLRRVEKTTAACRQIEQALATLLTGYTMNLDRISRGLNKQGLEPIQAVGEVLDPERMEVLEPVAGTGRPAGEVIEEVQRGYTYNGRVFRFARVRVARD